jgi:hypothetical protein
VYNVCVCVCVCVCVFAYVFRRQPHRGCGLFLAAKEWKFETPAAKVACFRLVFGFERDTYIHTHSHTHSLLSLSLSHTHTHTLTHKLHISTRRLDVCNVT